MIGLLIFDIVITAGSTALMIFFFKKIFDHKRENGEPAELTEEEAKKIEKENREFNNLMMYMGDKQNEN